jgi:hypothetical protein
MGTQGGRRRGKKETESGRVRKGGNKETETWVWLYTYVCNHSIQDAKARRP